MFGTGIADHLISSTACSSTACCRILVDESFTQCTGTHNAGATVTLICVDTHDWRLWLGPLRFWLQRGVCAHGGAHGNAELRGRRWCADNNDAVPNC